MFTIKTPAPRWAHELSHLQPYICTAFPDNIDTLISVLCNAHEDDAMTLYTSATAWLMMLAHHHNASQIAVTAGS